MPERQPITEEWLKTNGFKWHQLDRQPDKHWLLWLGGALKEEGGPSLTCYEDIGIELASMQYRNVNGELVGRDAWFCWLRSDSAGRYHRFIHLRHLSWTYEVGRLIEAITGSPFMPGNCIAGSLRTTKEAEQINSDRDRMDRRLLRDAPSWSHIEDDDTMGRALPEHRAAYEERND